MLPGEDQQVGLPLERLEEEEEEGSSEEDA